MIEHLVEVARTTTLGGGFPFHLERSHPTEAVYLRVERGGYWFGLRIAAHAPAYDCSADFAQLLVPRHETPESWKRKAVRRVEAFVEAGGRVVADPIEVQKAIERAFLDSSRERHRLPSTSEICAIRHRLNFRARWIFDEEQALREPASHFPTNDERGNGLSGCR